MSSGEMASVPPDFGGLLSYWIPDVAGWPGFGRSTGPRAVVSRYGHGKPIEGLTLTPLNLLQLHKIVTGLVEHGEQEGYITAEHRRQAILLPTTEGLDQIPDRKYVDDIAGED